MQGEQAHHPLKTMPKRAFNALKQGGIETLEDAAQWSDRDLLSLPNFGPASVARLRTLIAATAP